MVPTLLIKSPKCLRYFNTKFIQVEFVNGDTLSYMLAHYFEHKLNGNSFGQKRFRWVEDFCTCKGFRYPWRLICNRIFLTSWFTQENWKRPQEFLGLLEALLQLPSCLLTVANQCDTALIHSFSSYFSPGTQLKRRAVRIGQYCRQ